MDCKRLLRLSDCMTVERCVMVTNLPAQDTVSPKVIKMSSSGLKGRRMDCSSVSPGIW